MDLAFGAGLLAFDEVCKKVERIALRDEDELKTARAEYQVRSPSLLLTHCQRLCRGTSPTSCKNLRKRTIVAGNYGLH